MKHKKIIINLLVILAAFVLFIWWYERQKNAELFATLPTSLQNNFKIYLITKEKNVEFWEVMNQGAADMSDLLGMQYIWDAPETLDTDEQIRILNNAVNSGADAILLAANDADRLAEPVRVAKEKGVKIIYVDSPAKEEAITILATNNYEAGRIAGENMLDELEFAGIQLGEIGIVSVSLTNQTTLQREQGFQDVIKTDGRFTLLDTVYTLGNPIESQKAAENIIKQNPKLVGLFGTNQGSSEGVGSAIKEDNNRIIGIGFDQSKLNLELLNDNSFKAIINQNPYTMGYLGTAQAFAALMGYDTGPPYMNTGVSVLMKR